MKKEDKEQLHKISRRLVELLGPIVEQLQEYTKETDHSPEEEEAFRKTLEFMKEIAPAIEMLQNFFGHEAYKTTVAYYYYVKEKAAEGNEQAQEIVAELAPLYEQALLEKLNNN